MLHCCAQIWSPPWYCRTFCLRPRSSTPSPNDDIWGRELPSNVHPSIGGGHLRINSRPDNGVSTITTPSPTTIQCPINTGSDGDGPSLSIPTSPATERWYLWQKRIHAKQAFRTLPLCLVTSAGQGRPHIPPIHRLPHQHPSDCRGRRDPPLHHLLAECGEARQAWVSPPSGRLSAVVQRHRGPPISRLILQPLIQHPRW